MKVFAIALLCYFTGQVCFSETLEIAELTSPVIDEVGLISKSNQQRLAEKITSMHQAGHAQVQIYVIRSLANLTIEEASIKIVDKWRLGGEQQDNGVLILVAPQERRVRIEVGQGVEGVLTDAKSKRITSGVIIPAIKEGRLADGLLGALEVIEKIFLNESPNNELGDSPQSLEKKKRINWPVLIFIGLWLLVSVFGRRGPPGFRRRGSALPYLGGGFGGGFGNGSSSGGWSGGGGGFSGGGASDSW